MDEEIKIYNRYFVGSPGVLATFSWSNVQFTPNQDMEITKMRIVALWVPTAGGNCRCITSRFSIQGPGNFPLENTVDTLPGVVFNPNTHWGVTTPAGNYFETKIPCYGGQNVLIQGRCFVEGAAAFAIGDTIEFFMEMHYKNITQPFRV